MFGAGNVATHISRHLHFAGHSIACVYSRTHKSAAMLAEEVGSVGTALPGEVPLSADFFIVCVPDRVISDVVLKFQDRKGIWMHVSGTSSIKVFEGFQSQYGVLYPLQTMSKERTLSLEETPILVEGSSPESLEAIKMLASAISRNVHEMNSASRQLIHMAAVFANNFSNHMVHLAQQILQEEEVDVTLLDPMLKETFSKMSEMGAAAAQTGPALRGDQETMQKHLDLLTKHPEWEKLYTFISRDIGRFRNQ
ncbi:MAG: DUF2520 domain-containing protein [Bacteroidota bacterium]